MDADRIREDLYVGSCPITPDEIDDLDKLGVSAVLNLQTDDDFRYWGMDWGELEAHYARRGITVCRTPIRDFDRDALRETLPSSVQALAELLGNGHIVYLHCSAGVNRSPSTAIAYLHWVEGLPWEDAVNEVMAHRHCDPYLEAIEAAREDWKRRAEP
jgi:protein-tyrosine phosphatase